MEYFDEFVKFVDNQFGLKSTQYEKSAGDLKHTLVSDVVMHNNKMTGS